MFLRTPRFVKFPCVECIYEVPCFPLESMYNICICTVFIFQTKKLLMIVLATFQHYLYCGLLYTAADMRVFEFHLRMYGRNVEHMTRGNTF